MNRDIPDNTEPDTAPIDHWLSIWDAITKRYPSFEDAVEGLKFAVLKLYILQEPPSVRQARQERDR